MVSRLSLCCLKMNLVLTFLKGKRGHSLEGLQINDPFFGQNENEPCTLDFLYIVMVFIILINNGSLLKVQKNEKVSEKTK